MRQINKLIIHCSATPEKKDFDVEDITKWHLENGWSGCGYHYVIKLDGTVQEGRPLTKNGAHTYGHNRDSIGICYIGGMSPKMAKWKDTRTDEQKEALVKLLLDLKKDYPDAEIYGHKDFTRHKECPSFDAKTEYANLGNEQEEV